MCDRSDAPVPEDIAAFLGCSTPVAWLEAARDNEDLLLIDHANCEKKAASTAVSMMFSYAGNLPLVNRMSRLAREELRHFEQVQKVMARRGIRYSRIGPSRYAQSLRRQLRPDEPARLTDLLIGGAFIEARSCERFALLLPVVHQDLADLYRGLLASEAKHFRHYLALALRTVGDSAALESRVIEFREIETELIQKPDREFRFHSGPPHSG